MLSYQPYREAGHSQTYRTACNFIQTLTPNPATVSEDASGLVCIKVGGIFFSSASRKVMAYPTDCARFPWQVDSGKGHLEHFCRNSVPGGRQGKTPGTLLQEFRDRWTAGKDTWNTFAGKPWQVDGRERHLERFCRNSVTGGRQGKTPGTLLRENRGRWTAGKSYLERFRRNTVPGGRQEETPGTLLRENRGRWTAKQTEKPPFLLNLQGITHSYEHY